MATWAMKQRYDWITQKLEAGERFTRGDLVKTFYVTTQTASATLNEYRALHPDALRYDASAKAFMRADTPRVASITRPQIGAVMEVLAWLDERARNSTSYGSHADAYEIAARRLRSALGLDEQGDRAA
jgi:hypothetical protein